MKLRTIIDILNRWLLSRKNLTLSKRGTMQWGPSLYIMGAHEKALPISIPSACFYWRNNSDRRGGPLRGSSARTGGDSVAHCVAGGREACADAHGHAGDGHGCGAGGCAGAASCHGGVPGDPPAGRIAQHLDPGERTLPRQRRRRPRRDCREPRDLRVAHALDGDHRAYSGRLQHRHRPGRRGLERDGTDEHSGQRWAASARALRRIALWP
jgi:hypothetical protein